MGGTSTDVTHYAGEYERAFVTEVAGVRLRAPMMQHPHGRRRRRLDLHVRRRALSRRAGVRGRQSRSGLVSARRSADGHRLQRDGRQARSGAVSRRCSARAATSRSTPTSCARSSRRSPPTSQRATGMRAHARGGRRRASSQIAVENMANAIKHISVQRGYDVTEYTLCCFGGAGGQHACLVADALGMTRVFIHPLAGVLSAYGMGLADVRALRQQAVEATLVDGGARRGGRSASTRSRRRRATRSRAQGIAARRASTCRAHAAREVRRHRHDARDAAGERGRRRSSPSSSAATAQQYGFLMPGKALVIEAVAVEAIGRDANRRRTARRRSRRAPARCAPIKTQPRLHRRRVPRRAGLRARRPAARRRDRRARRSSASATRRRSIEPGWRATLTPRDHLMLERVEAARRDARDRHHRRSGAARGVQQPVHGDRRADGRDAREHRVLGQHQGAARFLVRAVRRRRQPHRQRAAHAGAPGLDGRER